MAPRNNRVTNSLVALSSAAVLSVYAAGYERTKAAADRFTVEATERRPAPQPVAFSAPLPVAEVKPAAPPSAPAKPAPAVKVAPKPKPVPPKPAPVATETATVTSAAMPAETATPATPANVAPEPVPPAPAPQVRWKDGTYTGWGTSRHGDIQAYVTIEGGVIMRAGIAQCLTRYSCSWIAYLPGQVVTRQSPEVDYVSGATQSVNAFYYAIVEALNKAK
jgi:uncharacterized protein with FMN-binding domain